MDELLDKIEIQSRPKYLTDPKAKELWGFLSGYVQERFDFDKRSYGRQFLRDYHNGRHYGSSLKSIKKYLNDRNGWIENEYGEKFTIEEFKVENYYRHCQDVVRKYKQEIKEYGN